MSRIARPSVRKARLTSRDRRKAETRTRLKAAAKAQFRRHGYEATTVRDIARAAGTSTGAVFANWTGKAELYREIVGHAPVSVELGARLLAGFDRLATRAFADRVDEGQPLRAGELDAAIRTLADVKDALNGGGGS